MRQKAIAGAKNGVKYTIHFTRAVIGEGRPDPDDALYYMTGLVLYAADMPVKESYAEDVNHLITVVLDNAELTQGVMMTEIGVMAVLLDMEGNEVLPEAQYGYTYTDKYDYLPASSSYIVLREITFDTVLSRTADFQVTFDASGIYATPQDLADHVADPNAHNLRQLIELSAADTPAVGTRLHMKILRSVPNWVTPVYDDPTETEDAHPAMLQIEGLGEVEGYLTLEDGSIERMVLETT